MEWLAIIGVMTLVGAFIALVCFLVGFFYAFAETERKIESLEKLQDQFWYLRQALKCHMRGEDDWAKAQLDKAEGA